MEKFILYLKNNGILVLTSSGGLKLNPHIKHLKSNPKIIVPDNSKEIDLNNNSSSVIKPNNDELHTVEKYNFPSFSDSSSSELKENKGEENEILSDIFGDLLVELEGEKKENQKLMEENKKLKEENEKLKGELEKLKNELKSIKNAKNVNTVSDYPSNFSIKA